jgi:hypothetical protein
MYEVIFFITLSIFGLMVAIYGSSDETQDEQKVIFTKEDERQLEKELEMEIKEDEIKEREQQLAKIRKRLKPKDI